MLEEELSILHRQGVSSRTEYLHGTFSSRSGIRTFPSDSLSCTLHLCPRLPACQDQTKACCCQSGKIGLSIYQCLFWVAELRHPHLQILQPCLIFRLFRGLGLQELHMFRIWGLCSARYAIPGFTMFHLRRLHFRLQHTPVRFRWGRSFQQGGRKLGTWGLDRQSQHFAKGKRAFLNFHISYVNQFPHPRMFLNAWSLDALKASLRAKHIWTKLKTSCQKFAQQHSISKRLETFAKGCPFLLWQPSLAGAYPWNRGLGHYLWPRQKENVWA